MKLKNKHRTKKEDPLLMPKSKHEMGYTVSELESFMSLTELKQFMEWMYGQTCAIGDDGSYLYYEYDVTRFLDMVRNGVPTIWD